MLSQAVELIVTDRNRARSDGTMMVNLHFSDLAPTVKRSFYASQKRGCDYIAFDNAAVTLEEF